MENSTENAIDRERIDLEHLKKNLIACAKEYSIDDDEDFDGDYQDRSGGNFDDAFQMGFDAGRISMARYLLLQYFGINLNSRTDDNEG